MKNFQEDTFHIMQQKKSIMTVANCGISLQQKWQRMLKLIRLIRNIWKFPTGRLHCNPAMKENHVRLILLMCNSTYWLTESSSLADALLYPAKRLIDIQLNK